LAQAVQAQGLATSALLHGLVHASAVRRSPLQRKAAQPLSEEENAAAGPKQLSG